MTACLGALTGGGERAPETDERLEDEAVLVRFLGPAQGVTRGLHRLVLEDEGQLRPRQGEVGASRR